MTATDIIQHRMTAGQSAPEIATPMAGASKNSPSSSSSTSSSITANDFLTLLVTELKNQDPTAATDPNAYINQLVEVNSLQQLISINQTLTSAVGGSSSTSSSAGKSAHPAASSATETAAAPSAAANGAAKSSAGLPSFANRAITSGNLSVPNANSAAEQVAHALDGHARSSSNFSLAGAQ